MLISFQGTAAQKHGKYAKDLNSSENSNRKFVV